MPSEVLPAMRDEYKSFRPMIDTKSTNLLKGLICSTVDNLENTTSGVRAIRIGNGATFTNEMAGDTIYERHFYPKLVSAIRCADVRVLLLGNPGTGKSVFQFYLLARYLNPSLFADAPLSGPIEFGSDAIPKVVVRHEPERRTRVWFLEQQVVQAISSTSNIETVLECFDPATTLYFFEPGTMNDGPFADTSVVVPTLATVSSNRDCYHEFTKLSAELFMPVFTEEELLAVGRDMKSRRGFKSNLQDLYSDDGIRFRFATFNGIIRHVLPRNQAVLDTMYRKRAFALNTVEPAKFLSGIIEDQSVSHYVAVYTVGLDADGSYDFAKVAMAPPSEEVTTKLRDLLNTNGRHDVPTKVSQ